MRKEVALLLASITCFDLGTIVVAAQAAQVDYFLKIDNLKAENDYLKLTGDEASAKTGCLAHKGTLVEYKGDHYCSTPKKAGGASKAAVTDVVITK